jgi:hypothetical protein
MGITKTHIFCGGREVLGEGLNLISLGFLRYPYIPQRFSRPRCWINTEHPVYHLHAWTYLGAPAADEWNTQLWRIEFVLFSQCRVTTLARAHVCVCVIRARNPNISRAASRFQDDISVSCLLATSRDLRRT